MTFQSVCAIADRRWIDPWILHVAMISLEPHAWANCKQSSSLSHIRRDYGKRTHAFGLVGFAHCPPRLDIRFAMQKKAKRRGRLINGTSSHITEWLVDVK